MLKPSQSQTVRILKRIPEGLEPGEYAAYVTFTEVLLEKAATKESLQPNTFSVKITPIPSFSIPVLVRYKVKESSPISLETKGLVDKNNGSVLRVVMHRQPQNIRTSARGDLSVWDGDEMIGYIKGRYILPATDSLETQIPLRLQNGITHKDGTKEDKPLTAKDLKGKTLKVLFTETDENQVQKDKLLSQTEIKL